MLFLHSLLETDLNNDRLLLNIYQLERNESVGNPLDSDLVK